KGRFHFDGRQLALIDTSENDKKVQAAIMQISKDIDDQINTLKKEQAAAQGQLPSAEKDTQLHAIASKIESYIRLKNKLLSGFKKASQLRVQEKDLLDKRLSAPP